MRRIKVLIADGEQGSNRRLLDHLDKCRDLEVIGNTIDGQQAILMVNNNVPDILIMSIVLSKIDGIEVLRRLHGMQTGERPAPRVIVYTRMKQEHYIESAFALGAFFYVIRPFDLDVLMERIREAAQVQPEGLEGAPEPSVHAGRPPVEVVSELLLCLGVPASHEGYGYLRTGILMTAENPELMHGVTKVLYPEIGRRHQVKNHKNVERSMRTSLDAAWERGRVDEANRLMGQTLFSGQARPTCKEFIALVSDQVRLRLLSV